MPCHYTLARDGNVVVERWVGQVTFGEIAAQKADLARDPAIRSGAAVLSDLTRAQIEISPEAINRLAAMEGDPQSAAKIARYAFLVSSDAFDRARLFESQAAKFGKTVIIFNSLDVACAWLGMDLKELRAILEGMDA